MNHRIERFFNEAGFHKPEMERLGIEHKFNKFAELIVRECVEVCNRVYFDNYPDAEDFERSEEGDAIKKHFGVEG